MYRSYADQISNTGIKPNPEAEVTTKTVDIVVVHLITNRIEYKDLLSTWPLSSVLLTHLCLASHDRDSSKQYIHRSDAAKRGV